MNFKDCLAQDLSTFLNLEEFAEEVEIDGVKISAVLTQTSAESQSLYTTKNQISPKRHLKLRGDFLVVYARAEDLPKQYKNGEFIEVNLTRYKISSVVSLHGLTKITCATDLDKQPPQLPRPF